MHTLTVATTLFYPLQQFLQTTCQTRYRDRCLRDRFQATLTAGCLCQIP